MAPWYALNLRRGDVNVELTADDPVFMADEMARWLTVMGLPAASQLLPSPKAASVVPKKPVIPTSLTDRLPLVSPSAENEPTSITVEKRAEPPQPVTHDKGIQLPGEVIAESNEKEPPLTSSAQQPSLLTPLAEIETLAEAVDNDADAAFNALFDETTTDDTFVLPPGEVDPVSVTSSPALAEVDWGDTALADRGQPEPDDDFERVMSTLMDDLNTQPALLNPNDAEDRNRPVTEDLDDEASTVGVFRREGMNGPVAVNLPSPSDDNPNSYAVLCERAGAATPEDHLLISAYALATSQGVERFSLSDLNVVIQGAGHDMVTHSVLAVAVDKGLLTAVADMTADATQYELTRHGRTTVEMFI